MKLRRIIILGLACLAGAISASAVDLVAQRPDATGRIRINSPGRTNQVHLLETSTNLAEWTEAARLQDGPFSVVMPPATSGGSFFRVKSRARTTADDGKNQVLVPHDRFNNTSPDFFSENPPGRWIKFALLLGPESRVWFQDSARHVFHYDWARLRLPPFQGMSREDFDARTLRRTNQLAVLGAILLPPDPSVPEYGIQFVGLDEYPGANVADWFQQVADSVLAPPGTRAWYIPTFEQLAAAQRDQNVLRQAGIEVAGADRWLAGDACYSDGWALGRLVFVPAKEIDAAYGDGRLRPDDILLTDGVPAEIPFVAGIVSLAPATPNSHVAILARSYEIPFGWSASASVRTNLLAWSGRVVGLRVGGGFRCGVEVWDTTGSLSAEQRDEVLVLRQPKPLRIPAKTRLGAYVTNVTELRPNDARYVGGKAANYGLLRRVLPTNSDPALALTFDLWDEFMAQPLGSRTLREEIRARLAGITWPPNIGAARTNLAAVRDLIRRTASFSPAQRQAIIAALQAGPVPITGKIRFRSSTNVEDSEEFTGAGLYDSYSGCLTDDLDGDAKGPSACDPNEPEERGVFRAIQRVYASFYNENAYLQRVRLRIDEDQVGMAVLVHESFPDPDELANGVATLTRNRGFSSPYGDVDLVTQLGAESVTNPDSAARPELVQGYFSGNSTTDTAVALREASGLVPLGSTVLAWEREYRTLIGLLQRVGNGYAALFPTRDPVRLDFEYKKSSRRGLIVKQVRPLPPPSTTTPVPPLLLNEPVQLQVLQGEFGNVFAIHRLKSHWTLSSRGTRLNPSGLMNSLLADASVRLWMGAQEIQLTNGPAGWPGARFSRKDSELIDEFVVTLDGETRRYQLHTGIPASVSVAAPEFLQSNRTLWRQLEVFYNRPQPTQDFEGIGTTTNDVVLLTEPTPIDARAKLQSRGWTNAGVRIQTRFYWPEEPRGPSAGYTAPCIGFVETRLRGLAGANTGEIILQADAAQSYHPFHHNFAEDFLFEPQLDPGVSPAVLKTLRDANIRAVWVSTGFQTAMEITVLGFDGKFRVLR